MAKKEAGSRSSQQNDFLKPLAPINVVATDVGTDRPYNNGAISVSFDLPEDSPEATTFTVSGFCSVHNTNHTASGSSSPIIVEGFGSSVSTTITVIATNEVGDSPESQASNIVDVTTVPDIMSAPTVSSPAPSAPTNTAGAQYDVVSWNAPDNGGESVTEYTWKSSDGKTGTTTATSVQVDQEGGTSQTYQVRASNANGSGRYSPDSNSITTFSFSPFSFAPFSAFNFIPFNFTPFMFTAFNFVPFSNFNFTPFNFAPFSAFNFTPFNFAPFSFTPFGFNPLFNPYV